MLTGKELNIMIEVGIFELVVVLIQCILMGVWGVLLWVQLRHKINTDRGRWGVLMFCLVILVVYLIF